MKWIKASERLPDKSYNYFVKIWSERTKYIYNDCNYFENGWSRLNNKDEIIEWLDESQEQQSGEQGFYLGEVLSIAKEISVDFAWENNLDKIKGYQYFRSEYDLWLESNKYINTKLASQPVAGEQDELWTEILSELHPYFLKEDYEPFKEKFKQLYLLIKLST